MDYSYDETQTHFLSLVANGSNVFLTGKAGSGKSTITKKAMNDLKSAGKNIAALAPTGVAAQNIGGQTVHSFFNLPVGGVINFNECRNLSSGKKAILAATDVIIIDEISMVRADMFDGIMWTLKKNGCKKIEHFQWLLIGDLKQLPPIADDNTRAVMMDYYNGVDFKESEAYQHLSFNEIELTNIHRQTDQHFISALNHIREGGRGAKHPYFRQFARKPVQAIVLAAHKETVDNYNRKGLLEQTGEMFTFDAEIDGTCKVEDFSLPAKIEVKDGCSIMYLANSKEDNRLVNGTIGIFRYQEGVFSIEVEGIRYKLEKFSQEKKKYILTKGVHPVTGKHRDELKLKVIGSITQYPFKLAYALTIHKAQGLTFERVTVDLTKPCFSDGQMYVALSRCTTPDGLSLIVNQ